MVVKYVGEEQISMQIGSMQGYGASEADDYLSVYVRSHALNEHIHLIKEAKKECRIPVIASINCYTDSAWTDFAQLMEQAVIAAGLINKTSLPADKNYLCCKFL